MGARPFHHAVLKRVILLAAAAIVLLNAAPADAHNEYSGGYRKFPWKGGRQRVLGTLPGECPHCPGSESSSAWKAIDVPGMDYETVYSIAPGAIDAYSAGGSKAGMYLRIRDADGTYVTYEHLSKALVTSGSVVAGEPIAVSGCSGNCSGAHLHFQRHDGPSFSSNALTLAPISAHGDDPSLQKIEYLSDNAGVGYAASGGVVETMQSVYRSAGGYRGVGVTANIGDGWSPCRNDDVEGTWWRYTCTPRDGISGSIQTFIGSGYRRRAIMREAGASDSYLLHQGILGAYTEMYAGQDWVYWLGYPITSRYRLSSGAYRQYFERGRIDYWPSSCRSAIYVGDSYKSEEFFCD